METYISKRLQTIELLADQAGEAVDHEQLLDNEVRAKLLHEDFGVLPTIGCEVEVKWSTLFPDLAEEFFGPKDDLGRFERRYDDLSPASQQELDAMCCLLDQQLKPKYEATKEMGVPAGSDAYWEFANNPTYLWETLAYEVSLLMKLGLIPEGYEHSLHVTLGGMSVEGGGMCMVLSGVELLTISPERILLATQGNRLGTNTAWARRGDDGIRQRLAGSLALEQEVGTELRTLTTASPDQLAMTLSTAQILSAVLAAFRRRKDTAHQPTQALAGLWPVYRSELKALWEHNDLPAASWGPPTKNLAAWEKWAGCLAAREVNSSTEHQFGEFIQEITQDAKQILGQF